MKRIFSPGTKRKRDDSSTPMKRVRAKMEEGCDFGSEPDLQLSCRALCDCVIACAAAKGSEGKKSALDDLEELLMGDARKGLTYKPNGDLSGTPLHLAAMLDCPEAAGVLVDKGASLVAKFDDVTPLEAAIKHNSKQTLAVLLGRIQDLEQQHRQHDSPHRPGLQRAWTHTNVTGSREGRIHRREDVDERKDDQPSQPPRLKSATRRSRA